MNVATATRSDGATLVVCERCEVADTAPRRLRGLLGRVALEAGEGLLIRPAPAIHTFFMRFAIDAVFLDRDDTVLAVRPSLAPWRTAGQRGARAVLELRAGQAGDRGLAVGDRLTLMTAAAKVPESVPEDLALDSETPSQPPRPRASTLPPVTWPVSALLATAVAVRYGVGARGLIGAGFVAVLVVLSSIDIQTRLLPNRIVLPATTLVLAAQVGFFPARSAEWVLAGLGAAAFLALPLIIRRGSLGMGDLKLAVLLGVGLGRSVIDALFYGSLAAFPVAAVILIRGGRGARGKAIPFGPFLSLGAIIALFTGHHLG